MLVHGKNLKWYESLEEQGEIPPPAYYERPMLYQDLYDAYKAFTILDAARQTNPIQISEILAYCDLFRINDLEYRKILTERIQFMDKIYLKEEGEKQTTNPKT